VQETVVGYGISGVESYGYDTTDLVNGKNELREKCVEDRILELGHDLI
jgi:hypothetical protein